MTRKPQQRLKRVLQLISLLKARPELRTREIADILRVTRRQVFRDLAQLRSSGVDLRFDAKRYRYDMGHELSVSQKLTADEWNALEIAGMACRRGTPRLPYLEAAYSATQKLMVARTGVVPGMQGFGPIAFRSPARPNDEHSREHFERIVAAMVMRSRLRITCQVAIAGRSLTTLLSPYRLMLCDDVWYVIGRSSVHRAVRFFPIGRVITSEVTTVRYMVPVRFDVEKHIGGAWRVLRGTARASRVTVRFSPLVADVVSSYVWHKSQVLHWEDEGRLLLSVTVDGLEEIGAWICSFGDLAEVVSPPALRMLVSPDRFRHSHRRSSA
jgi:predicted DNA-binding transcriptional regulator YafY